MTKPSCSHPTNRHQEDGGRHKIRKKHETTPSSGSSHGPRGTRNGRARSGSLRRRMGMPTQTRMKAKSVPMFVRSMTSSMEAKAAKTPTKTPVRIVVTCGVLYFGWTEAKVEGSSPSRAIEKKMRGWPNWKTSSKAVCAQTEPKE